VPVPKGGFLRINNTFFYIFNNVQCTLAFLLTTFIGPGLVSPDLVNNAPLYFIRPISRTEYVLGRSLSSPDCCPLRRGFGLALSACRPAS
jgi:hypothetical protein